MRGINNRFINDLLAGELSFFLNAVKENPSLFSLAIRSNYINIYYRGGNLIKIIQNKKGYTFHFNALYCLHKQDDSAYDKLHALCSNSITDYQDNFNLMLTEMDSWFLAHPKLEREYQQQLLYHNPSIIDIEYQVNLKKNEKMKIMRLDMLLVQDNIIYLVENKYGEDAIKGKAGISKHYMDMCEIVKDNSLFEEVRQSIVNIANARKQLGLSEVSLCLKDFVKVEFLFLFANCNYKRELIEEELMNRKDVYPTKLLMLDKNDYVIDLQKATDLFL